MGRVEGQMGVSLEEGTKRRQGRRAGASGRADSQHALLPSETWERNRDEGGKNRRETKGHFFLFSDIMQ